MNIKELRELIDSYESKWNPEMEKYFGKYEEQDVYISYLYKTDNYMFSPAGVGDMEKFNVSPDWELGLVFRPTLVDKDNVPIRS